MFKILLSFSTACFKKIPKSYTPGARRIYGISNLVSCESNCLMEEWCVAFEYHTVEPACSFHSAETLKAAKLVPKETIDQYKRVCFPGMFSCNLIHRYNGQLCGVTYVSVRYILKCVAER